jgi:ABC-type lipoprotein release transport system permease subunit
MMLLMGVIAAVTLGIHTTVSATDSILQYGFYMFHYLNRMTRVSAADGLDTAIAAQIRAHPGVAHVILENGLEIHVPGPGIPLMFPVLGVAEDDLSVVMETCNLRLKEGRLIKPRAAEIMVSEEIARPLGLQVGDGVSRETDEEYYAGFVTELTVVGILESIPTDTDPEVRAAFASYEYLDSHELYGPRPSSLLVIPHKDHKPAVDSFLETLATEADGTLGIDVETFEGNSKMVTTMRSASYGAYGLTDALLVGAATLAVAFINQISITQRLPELGLLHALGNQRRRLTRRLVLEVAAVAALGWGLGLACSMVLSTWLNAIMYAPRGELMNPSRLAPFLFTIPIPLAVIVFAGVGIGRTLRRLDAVSIIERGKLSVEDTGSAERRTSHSSPKPLSPVTFYTRHRRRGLLLFAVMALMVLGVAFPVFSTAVGIDGNIPWMMNYLHRASIVSPAQSSIAVDPEVIAHIQAHPASAHVIPAKPRS